MKREKNTKKITWTLEKIISGLELFYSQNKRYPTATEVDKFNMLPSSRTIERSFGGLPNLRKKLKNVDQLDFRMGKHSSQRALKINARAQKTEEVVYTYLVKRFGRQFVHREYFFTDDARTRADFFIYDKQGNFCVDVFYASNIRNVTGCINIKQKKYQKITETHPVIFLHMNKDIDQESLNQLMGNKKNKLTPNQVLIGWDRFLEYCDNRDPLIIENL